MRPRADYAGPPAYPEVPRWGLPRLAWRRSTAVPGGLIGASAVTRRTTGLAHQARLAMLACWLVAAASLLAGAGEIWRYALLVLGQDQALSPAVVSMSDIVLNSGAVLSIVFGLVALVLVLRWLLAARSAAARHSGSRPARGDGAVLAGVLVPGWNLVTAGSILAELEHAARASGVPKVRPSRPVLAWWLAWGVGELLAIGTLCWGLQGGVAAQAYGVLWHAATDLVAVLVAVLTGYLVASITALVAPSGQKWSRYRRVIRIETDPEETDEPVRRPRPAGSVR
ncbi:MAG TPA: DUF4328 domain-containing protein [Pseudonocardiaceae bacterium]|nr:DUF4328 domain-containing protein [Pseudonocardiaceae bacterium]